MLESAVAALITTGTHLLTGVQSRWVGCGPADVQRIYFANHTSHADFALLWCSLPKVLRCKTRPVAAKDYWSHGAIRRYLIHRIFRGVLVERGLVDRHSNPLAPMLSALDGGESLILFPEGTRGSGQEVQPFKGGIYHLAELRPSVELVPAWIENSYRVMPKGALLPIPLLCSVTFGMPVRMEAGEHKPAFLDRLRQSLVALENA
jgi:1-acyl-sn-glycerol-3-phosphate acyltransferase